MAVIEFTIENLINGDGLVTVDGRCCEATISLGDVFSSQTGHSTRWDADRSEFVAIDPGPASRLLLTVISIEAYRHRLHELSSGMTARVQLTGDPGEGLAVGKLLRGETSRADER